MRGADQERFAHYSRAEGTHLIWRGGPQFRFANGHRCAPTQAAYLLMKGIARLPVGAAVASTCTVTGCVSHLRLTTLSVCADISGRLSRARRLLTRRQVIWLRSQPDLRKLSPAARRVAMDEICARLGFRIARSHVSNLKSRATWGKAYADAIPDEASR